ncbi:MAG: N-acetylmuramoyl-L-alanine amidase [Candidatus Accumulibacter sp.]|jgi:N-acetylmuramoyl-L-alanine amidase|nr:N-acetylmuramoyl-L-alanine amidase [Accumulibacter sp.]
MRNPATRRSFWRCLPLALCLALCACVTSPPRVGNTGAQWHPSPNFGARKANFVILHHTSSDTLERALATLTNPIAEVSSHYLIGRDGRLLQLVDENQRAWHAGESYWGGDADMNSSSIGIELVNNGKELFPPAQVDALLALLADIQARHNIPRANFIGHADVAPGRKADPSAFFPWRRLAMAGFGLWCEPPHELPPDGFNAMLALSALGYDVRDPYRAMASFKLHFSPGGGKDLSLMDLGMLYCLQQQVMTSGRE